MKDSNVTSIKVKHESGWNGGSWDVVERKLDAVSKVEDLPANVRVKIKGIFIDACVSTKYGADYDMGHQYDWEVWDLTLKVNTNLGTMDFSFYDYIQKHPRVKTWEIFYDKGL